MADPRYYVGLDLGQVSDYTAIAVLERPDGAASDVVYALRHLERLPLSTGYPDVASETKHLMGKLPPGTPLLTDATGVGRAVIDVLRVAGLTPTPVVVHGGDQTTVVEGYHRVPKRELVTAAQVLLQQRRLKVAAGLPLVKVLVEELQNFEVKISDGGHDSYGAWREGKHDDLVFAVALACWWVERHARLDEWLARHPTQPMDRRTGRVVTFSDDPEVRKAEVKLTRDRAAIDKLAKSGGRR